VQVCESVYKLGHPYYLTGTLKLDSRQKWLRLHTMDSQDKELIGAEVIRLMSLTHNTHVRALLAELLTELPDGRHKPVGFPPQLNERASQKHSRTPVISPCGEWICVVSELGLPLQPTHPSACSASWCLKARGQG
jgi:hypothetical protein